MGLLRRDFLMSQKNRHYEDYVWRDFAIARKVLKIIFDIIENTNHNIEIRVGPFEDPRDYNFLEKKYGDRVRIRKPNEQLKDFIKDIDLLLTCWSTTGREYL